MPADVRKAQHVDMSVAGSSWRMKGSILLLVDLQRRLGAAGVGGSSFNSNRNKNKVLPLHMWAPQRLQKKLDYRNKMMQEPIWKLR